jgi:cell division protein FtsB
MIILVNRFLLRKNFLGLTLWPFVILKYKELRSDEVFLNHERIHLRQQLEMLILPFYIWYLIEFIVRLIQYKNGKLAYRNISFEREAYTNEKDLQYLNRRSFWKFLTFI